MVSSVVRTHTNTHTRGRNARGAHNSRGGVGARKLGETTNEREREAAVSSTITGQSQPPWGEESPARRRPFLPRSGCQCRSPRPLSPCTLLGFGSYLRSGPFDPATPLAGGVGSYFHTPGLGRGRERPPAQLQVGASSSNLRVVGRFPKILGDFLLPDATWHLSLWRVSAPAVVREASIFQF